MSDGKVLKGSTKRTSKFAEQIKNIPISKSKWKYILSFGLIASAMVWVPIFLNFNLLIGSFIGLPEINEEDARAYIGYYKLESIGWNSTRTYEDVNITVDLLNYYTQEIIEEDKVFNNNGTIYYTDNVTIIYVKSVESFESGLSYPNYTSILFASNNSDNPVINRIALNPLGKSSDFDLDISRLDDVEGTYTLNDITSEEFQMSFTLENLGNGTFGELYYIPSPYRYIDDIYNIGFWAKFNCIISNMSIFQENDTTSIAQDIYYDDLGNSFFLMPLLLYRDSYQLNMTYICETIPTRIDFIQGQWNNDIIFTLLAV
ncbi:MAG: hypothetical protein WC934_02780 [Acidithiobacillus sp.]|jgi:hypothetical protein|uniref:hypothetical protein n=1 Tax=Acidithiobacillus sp. TaxID=1872118 RepID=UPI00356092B6